MPEGHGWRSRRRFVKEFESLVVVIRTVDVFEPGLRTR